ncbi:hypothetical protein [Shimia sp. R9_3]|uniref:hypothetical protein n=1 Tax=Shimia sp. R9_3 TaxID=2821113 RepID=UPI001AD95AF1|nr:hypothetical protein [Shimia sp. R9_3]MBO9402534.1 hypothetical protein [Shimia sp. R9_3]
MKAINSGEPSPTIPGKANDEACPEFPVIKHYATHRQLARAFCDNDVLYYVGDVEIVRAMLQREKCIDSSIIAPATFTVERYGIYTALPQREVLTAAILVFLSELSLQIHGGYIGDEKSGAVVKESPSALLDIVYEQTFEGYSPSRNLLDFFWNITGSYPHAN